MFAHHGAGVALLATVAAQVFLIFRAAATQLDAPLRLVAGPKLCVDAFDLLPLGPAAVGVRVFVVRNGWRTPLLGPFLLGRRRRFFSRGRNPTGAVVFDLDLSRCVRFLAGSLSELHRAVWRGAAVDARLGRDILAVADRGTDTDGAAEAAEQGGNAADSIRSRPRVDGVNGRSGFVHGSCLLHVQDRDSGPIRLPGVSVYPPVLLVNSRSCRA